MTPDEVAALIERIEALALPHIAAAVRALAEENARLKLLWGDDALNHLTSEGEWIDLLAAKDEENARLKLLTELGDDA